MTMTAADAYYQKFIRFIDTCTYCIFQAVLVCCRADDFNAGKNVFQRQWKNMSFSTKDDEVSQQFTAVFTLTHLPEVKDK